MAVTDPLNHTSTTAYDAVGNVTAQIDALGHAATFSYDVLNRLEAVTRPSGGVFTTVYDEVSNVIASVDPLGNRTTLVYDALNRAVQQIDARNYTTTAVYDAASNRTVLIDPAGNRTTSVYDVLNRVTQEIDPLGASATYAYDAASRMTGTTDRLNRRRDFTFDAVGQLTREVWVNVGGGTANTLTFTYDPEGGLLSAADADGAITFTYDELGRARASKDLFNVLLTFSYDANSNRTQVQDSFGGLTTSTFDEADRLTVRKYAGQGATLRFDYAYSNRDEMIGVTRYSDLAGSSKVGATSFSYDTTGRLQNLKHQNAAGSWFHNATYVYDTADRKTSETLNGTAKNYTYDNTDQLTGDNGTAYSYDGAGNRTNTGYTTGTGNQLTNDGTWTYTYDAEGSRTKRSKGSLLETWTYGYDHDNHLVWVEKRATDGGTLQQRVDYRYDALGRRIERTADNDGNGTTDTTERYSYDGGDVIADLNSSNALVTRRVYGDGYLAAPEARVSSAGTVAWYMADRLGSIVALSDAAGVVQSQVTYDGFGKVLTESNANFGDRFKYTGQELDTATGDQFHSARFYDPATGRWLSRDPIGFAAGDANLYRYVGNNSTNFVDPTGLDKTPDWKTRAEKTANQDLGRLPTGVDIQTLTDRVRIRIGQLGAKWVQLRNDDLCRNLLEQVGNNTNSCLNRGGNIYAWNADERLAVYAALKEIEALVEALHRLESDLGADNAWLKSAYRQMDQLAADGIVALGKALRQKRVDVNLAIEVAKARIALEEATNKRSTREAAYLFLGIAGILNPWPVPIPEIIALAIALNSGDTEAANSFAAGMIPYAGKLRGLKGVAKRESGIAKSAIPVSRIPVQPTIVKDAAGRLKSSTASIKPENLYGGTGTTEAARSITRPDDAGHVIGRLLGGQGGATSDNIFAQLPAINRGAFKQHEAWVASQVRAGKGVHVQIEFVYPDATGTRPAMIRYHTTIDGVTTIKDFPN